MNAKTWLIMMNLCCLGATMFFAGYLLLFSPFVVIRHESAQGPDRIAQIANTNQLREECETMALELQGAFFKRNTDFPIFAVYILFMISLAVANMLIALRLQIASAGNTKVPEEEKE